MLRSSEAKPWTFSIATIYREPWLLLGHNLHNLRIGSGRCVATWSKEHEEFTREHRKFRDALVILNLVQMLQKRTSNLTSSAPVGLEDDKSKYVSKPYQPTHLCKHSSARVRRRRKSAMHITLEAVTIQYQRIIASNPRKMGRKKNKRN